MRILICRPAFSEGGFRSILVLLVKKGYTKGQHAILFYPREISFLWPQSEGVDIRRKSVLEQVSIHSSYIFPCAVYIAFD
jgi:hypothetical protein